MSRASTGEAADPRPRMVVWELTLRCDLACAHCGSRAGKPRAAELTTDEGLDVIAQLAALGTREIAFIGGEAYLHPGWLAFVRATARAGIRATMVTGGRQLDAARIRDAARAGMHAISVSVDGLAPAHDRLRGVRGSHAAAMATLARIRDAGLVPLANTQLGRCNLDDLEPLADRLADTGVRAWQIGPIVPLGRGADIPDALLQPFDLVALMPRLAALARTMRARGCAIHAANNLGYFGPDERMLRPARGGWASCAAGVHVLALESNGDLKGCPSLPSADHVGGNVRDRPIAAIWADAQALGFNRRDRRDELWGFCATCPYASACRGGCSYTAHALLGRRGNNPLCHSRALALRDAGVAERLVQVARAPGRPFDHGRFEISREPWTDAHAREAIAPRRRLPQVG